MTWPVSEDLSGLSVSSGKILLPNPTGSGPGVEVSVAVADGLLPARPPSWLALTRDDVDRIAAFRREQDARRFVTGRALVSVTVHALLGERAHGLRFARRFTEAGETKPRFEPDPVRAGPLPEVSISHSGNLVAVVFTTGAEVGVDVELHASFAGPDDPAFRLALTPAERARLRSRSDAADAFTAKEAVLKAIGWGLVVDPLRVEILDGKVARFDAPQSRPVSLIPLQVPGAASAYVAVAGPRRNSRVP